MTLNRFDVFTGLNLLLFLIMAAFRYYARFIEYRGIEHIEEFFIYAVLILGAIVVLWRVFRRHPFPLGLLVLMQLGILMHFGGAFVSVDGSRLFDAHFLGIRYDKFVHFINAFTAALLVSHLFRIQKIALTGVNRLFLVLVVLGLGGVVEIVEYLVLLSVPDSGVGDYDNNLQDLIANLCGTLTFVVLQAAYAGRGAAAGKADDPPRTLP